MFKLKRARVENVYEKSIDSKLETDNRKHNAPSSNRPSGQYVALVKPLKSTHIEWGSFITLMQESLIVARMNMIYHINHHQRNLDEYAAIFVPLRPMSWRMV